MVTTFGLIGAATFVGSIVPTGGLVTVVLAADSPDVGVFGFIGADTLDGGLAPCSPVVGVFVVTDGFIGATTDPVVCPAPTFGNSLVGN